MNRRYIDKTYSLLLLVLLVACETKIYEGEKVNQLSGRDLNEGTFYSETDFSGVKSAYDITDTTVSLSWDDNSAASEYHIFDNSSGIPKFLAKIIAPANNFLVSELDSGKKYEFLVRIKDKENLMDDNTATVEATTLSTPLAASLIVRTNPTKENDVIRTPSFVIFGINVGDYVELYTDSSCSTKVGDGEATRSFITIETSELAVDNSYSFYVKRTNHKDISSPCSTVSATYNLRNCPDGYISVPANPDLSIQEFCVMKYEAKAWSDSDSDNLVDSIEVDFLGCSESGCTTKNWGTSSYKPGSTANGNPWRMLDIQTAKNECQSLGDNYDLISNLEWMTIAENIEKQTVNWSGAAIGSGCLFRGNNGVSDACGYNNSGIDSGAVRDLKSSMTLSNGEILWDFSGNVSEWVDWKQDENVTRVPIYCDDTWSDITPDFCDGAFLDTDFLPFNPLNLDETVYLNSYGLGQIEGGTGGVLVRGGSYSYEEHAGIYSVSMAQTEESAREEIGFRCVYRIEHP